MLRSLIKWGVIAVLVAAIGWGVFVALRVKPVLVDAAVASRGSMEVTINEEGVTIIQVTHSERNASFGSRIIELVDGNVRSDEQIRQPSGQADAPKGVPNGK